MTYIVTIPNIMDFPYNGLTHIVDMDGGGWTVYQVPRKVPKVPITGTCRYLLIPIGT